VIAGYTQDIMQDLREQGYCCAILGGAVSEAAWRTRFHSAALRMGVRVATHKVKVPSGNYILEARI